MIRLSHGYCPMGNAMQTVPSYPIPWNISHWIPWEFDFYGQAANNAWN